MEIWAHTLVKNEARWLWYSVNSVINYVDKVLLWDTGSTDGSLEIEEELKQKYPEKVILGKYRVDTPEDFTIARQKMLEATKSDWFLVLDGDEIWWSDSIQKVVDVIQEEGEKIESIIVPTVNLVGDIFHFQEELGGNYKFGNKRGHFNLRAINMNIPGLKALGPHGQMGWVDEDNKQIQDRDSNLVRYVEAPYIHATFLPRATEGKDRQVVKRSKKYKFEWGVKFPLDYYYPESFFEERPEFVQSPWKTTDNKYKVRATIETPLRMLKRRVFKPQVGY